jgi:hypothetical protein
MQVAADALLEKMVADHAVSDQHQNRFCHRQFPAARGCVEEGSKSQSGCAGVASSAVSGAAFAQSPSSKTPAACRRGPAGGGSGGPAGPSWSRCHPVRRPALAGAEQLNAGDLQAGAAILPVKIRLRRTAQPPGQHLGLAQTGRHQPQVWPSISQHSPMALTPAARSPSGGPPRCRADTPGRCAAPAAVGAHAGRQHHATGGKARPSSSTTSCSRIAAIPQPVTH